MEINQLMSKLGIDEDELADICKTIGIALSEEFTEDEVELIELEVSDRAKGQIEAPKEGAVSLRVIAQQLVDTAAKQGADLANNEDMACISAYLNTKDANAQAISKLLLEQRENEGNYQSPALPEISIVGQLGELFSNPKMLTGK